MLRHRYPAGGALGQPSTLTAEHKAQLRDLLSRSTTNHSRIARLASQGFGVDRHLFALYSIAQQQQSGQSLPALFQDTAWARLNATGLSTSNVNAECLCVFCFFLVIVLALCCVAVFGMLPACVRA